MVSLVDARQRKFLVLARRAHFYYDFPTVNLVIPELISNHNLMALNLSDKNDCWMKSLWNFVEFQVVFQFLGFNSLLTDYWKLKVCNLLLITISTIRNNPLVISSKDLLIAPICIPTSQIQILF